MKGFRTKVLFFAAFMVASLTAVAGQSDEVSDMHSVDTVAESAKPKVYMTRDISPESLVKIYKALALHRRAGRQ